jgi:hypothetical protein
MNVKLWFVATMMAIAVTCIGAPEETTGRAGSREASKRNLDTVLKYLEPLINSSGKAVRLYYRARCRSAHSTEDFVADAPVPFPVIKVRAPSKGKTGLAAIREIFEDEKDVMINEAPPGIIRIWIGQVPTEILHVKLSQIALDPTGQYNPDNAIEVALGAKEIAIAMRSLKFSSVIRGGGLIAEPDKDLPHLPESIMDTTLEHLLDIVAKTWAGEGLVLYGACAEPTESGGRRLFWIDYIGDIAPIQKNTKK